MDVTTTPAGIGIKLLYEQCTTKDQLLNLAIFTAFIVHLMHSCRHTAQRTPDVLAWSLTYRMISTNRHLRRNAAVVTFSTQGHE